MSEDGATIILRDLARQEAIRERNKVAYPDEWAAEQAAKMGVEMMLSYIYTPNSSTLEKAIRARLRRMIKEEFK